MTGGRVVGSARAAVGFQTDSKQSTAGFRNETASILGGAPRIFLSSGFRSEFLAPPEVRQDPAPERRGPDRPITVETVLFEISNSMKPYPSAFHAHTSKLRLVTGFFEPNPAPPYAERLRATGGGGGASLQRFAGSAPRIRWSRSSFRIGTARRRAWQAGGHAHRRNAPDMFVCCS